MRNGASGSTRGAGTLATIVSKRSFMPAAASSLSSAGDSAAVGQVLLAVTLFASGTRRGR
jgi:hypothetical protein